MEDFRLKSFTYNNYPLIGFENDYISVILSNYGGWEDNIRYFFNQVLKEGDTVLEGGAYIGWHTISLSKLVGDTGRVVAFEPHPMSYAVLGFNLLAQRCLHNVNYLKQGLWDKHTQASIGPLQQWKGKNNYGGTEIYEEFDHYGANQIQEKKGDVECVTIDSLNLERLDLIKIDIEGAELRAIKGGEETIKKFLPYLVVEVNESVGTNKKEILGYFKKLGYKVFQSVDEKGSDMDHIFLHPSKIDPYPVIQESPYKFMEV